MKLLKISILMVALIGLIGKGTALGDTYEPNDPNCSTGLVEPNDWQESAPFDGSDSNETLQGQTLPDAFDWRDYDVVPAIRNQGYCGSCWAFATVAPFESAIMQRNGGIEIDLSEQWLVSCNNSGWGCNGGFFAHDYHLPGNHPDHLEDDCGDSGAVYEEDFPYVADDVACNCPYNHPYDINDWFYIGDDAWPSVEEIKAAIYEYGPVACAAYATIFWQVYDGGVFDGCLESPPSINHAIVLVGWDDNYPCGGVWILRNSWGTDWGENGYMRIPYECDNVGYAANYVIYDGNGWQKGEDIDPETFDWGLTTELSPFYVMDDYNNGQWVSIKFVDAQKKLIAGHGHTAVDSNIPHYHYRYDFTAGQKANANRYWDWYYNVSDANVSRVSDTNATNVTNHLSYAMDGYINGADYDYAIIPDPNSDKIFTDDCTKRSGSSTSENDRLAYEDVNNVYQHVSIVKTVSGGKPTKIQWKCDYSGIYEYTFTIPSSEDYCGTPGRQNLDQKTGDPPTGTWDQDYWDGDDVDIYHN